MPPNARTPLPTLDHLRDALREFARERDWEQFHSPKNLAIALAVEAAEILEPLQWMSEEESSSPAPKVRAALAEELADVLIYLVRLADRLDVDLLEAASSKLEGNARKYPVERSKGSARKYTDLPDPQKGES